jgi:hypothetical protein
MICSDPHRINDTGGLSGTLANAWEIQSLFILKIINVGYDNDAHLYQRWNPFAAALFRGWNSKRGEYPSVFPHFGIPEDCFIRMRKPYPPFACVELDLQKAYPNNTIPKTGY